jgi:hypothetical protein
MPDRFMTENARRGRGASALGCVQIGAANGGERYLDKHFTGMKFIRQCCCAHLERLVSTVEKLNACGHYF